MTSQGFSGGRLFFLPLAISTLLLAVACGLPTVRQLSPGELRAKPPGQALLLVGYSYEYKPFGLWRVGWEVMPARSTDGTMSVISFSEKNTGMLHVSAIRPHQVITNRLIFGNADYSRILSRTPCVRAFSARAGQLYYLGHVVLKRVGDHMRVEVHDRYRDDVLRFQKKYPDAAMIRTYNMAPSVSSPGACRGRI